MKIEDAISGCRTESVVMWLETDGTQHYGVIVEIHNESNQALIRGHAYEDQVDELNINELTKIDKNYINQRIEKLSNEINRLSLFLIHEF